LPSRFFPYIIKEKGGDGMDNYITAGAIRQLREHLCQYMNEEDAYKLSEAVRRGWFYGGHSLREHEDHKYKDILALLSEDIVRMFSRIEYLPEKALMQRIIHYAILAANSLIKNNNEILLELS
jgi:hypothetical protein